MKQLALLFFFFLLTSSVSAQAVKPDLVQCVPNQSSPTITAWRWPRSATVTVYAQRNDFSLPEVMTIKRAIDSWNVALTDTAANVRFLFAGEHNEPVAGPNSIIVSRGPTFQHRRRLAEIYRTLDAERRLVHASVTIDPGVTDVEVMTSVLAHELGHSLGIDDCPKCRRGTTLMALYRGRNRGNEALVPTPCDRFVVGHAYQQGMQTKSEAAVLSLTEMK